MSERGLVAAAGMAGVVTSAGGWLIASGMALGRRDQGLFALLAGSVIVLALGRRLIGPRYFAMRQTGRARLLVVPGVALLVVAMTVAESSAAFPLLAVAVFVPLVVVIDAALIWDQLDATPRASGTTVASPRR